jgi:ferritin-like metal-binding protein YciE
MATKMNTLEDLFMDQLKDLYSSEKQLIKALPKMARKASSPDLKQGLEQHLEQTKHQAERLEKIFSDRQASPGRKKCKGMEGIILEGDELMSEEARPEVMDAGLIAAAQKAEHYEIATYGTARAYAERLGYKDAAKVLNQILEEEAKTNEKLTALAESHINQEAMA